MGVKESLMRVLAGPRNLKANKLTECDVDRVGALAYAQMPTHHIRNVENANRAAREAALVTLGRHVLALRLSNDVHSHAIVVDKLAVEVESRLKHLPATDREWRAREVAKQAIREYLFDMCPVCQGKGKVPDHDKPNLRGRQPMTVCPECSGTRKRLYTLEERAKTMGLDSQDLLVRERVEHAIIIMKGAAKKCEVHFIEARGLAFPKEGE